MHGCLVDPVRGVAVTDLGATDGKDEPAPLEALQAASDPSDAIIRAVSPHPCCRQAVAIRRNAMMRERPVRRLVVIGSVWSLRHTSRGPERLVGGRRQVAWYITQPPMRKPRCRPGETLRWEPVVGVAGHRLVSSRWSPRASHAGKRWIARLIGWIRAGRHAVLLADEGGSSKSPPHGSRPGPGIRPVVAGRLLLDKSSPTWGARLQEWFAAFTARR